MLKHFGSNFGLLVLVSFSGIFEDVNEMLSLWTVSEASKAGVGTTYCTDNLPDLLIIEIVSTIGIFATFVDY